MVKQLIFRCFLFAITNLWLASPAIAEVSATFTTGAIAEYSGPNANQNDNAVSFENNNRAIESVVMSQAFEEWGGTQGNDKDVTLTINFYDGTSTTASGALNWVGKINGNLKYFGVIFPTQPSDGYVVSSARNLRTYILPIPAYVDTFPSLLPNNTDGSADFTNSTVVELSQVLNTNYGNSAELSLVKTAMLNDDDGTTGVSAGDTISYTFIVQNTGGLTVTDITLTDNLSGIALSGGPIASLAPGTSDNSTFTGTYTITQTDINNGGVRNTATASGDSNGDGTADVSDTSGSFSYLDQATDVVFNQTSALALVKTATLNDTDGSGDHSAGDTISFNFAIHNTGDQTVTGIMISDPLVTVSGGPIDLASGTSDTVTFTGTYTVTQSDVDSGRVTNSAYVSGTDTNGWTVSDISGTAQDNDTSTVVPLNASPSIALIKGGVLNDGGNGANAGDTISYNFTIINTGNVTLSNIQISDTMLEGAGGTLSGGPVSLAPGAVDRFSFTGHYTLTTADITAGSVSNTATVTGSSPGNTDDVSDISGTTETNDTDTVVSLNISPSIEGWKLSTITDADSSGALTAGDTIVYTISVKNTGNVVLTNVGVQSDTLRQADGTLPANTFSSSDFSVVLGSSTTLKPGEVAQFRGSYVVAQADIDAGGLSNTATVSAVYNGTTYTDVTHDAADTDGTITNASDPTENLVPNVAPIVIGPNSSTGATSAISVNENQTAVFSFSANEAVTWSISGDDYDKFSIDSSTGVLSFISAPDYENPNDVGATSGNNTYLVVVTGEDAGGSTTSQAVTVTVLDLKGSLGGTVTYSNGSTAAGVDVYLRDSSDNELDSTRTDSAGEYTFTDLSAGNYVIEFVHSTKGARGRSSRGQNNGRFVRSIELVEQDFTDVDGILIDPSGVVYNSLTRLPVSGAVVRLYVTPDDNSTRVQVQNSWLETSGGGGLSGQSTGAGGEYAFILNGSAPSGIYDIVVTPPSTFIYESLAIPATSGPYVPRSGAGIETIQTQSTAPTGGDATTYYLEFDFEITGDTATTSNGIINNHIPIDPIELTVTKTADTTDFSSPVTSGDTITYTITAENTGNVALDNVRITDTQTPTGGSSSSLTPTYISGDTDSDSAIDVGETWTWTVSYDLTQADIDAGGLSNLATVTVDDPDGTEITVESSTSGNHTTGAGNGTGTSTTLTPSPGLTVTKTADKTTISPSSAGDTISYTITVKNTGNVTFNSLSLTDALTSDEAWSESDGGDADGTGALDVGETWTFTASYAITPSDITEGSVENVAYATGIPTSGGSLTVYSGAQDEASTATSDPSGGGGVITTLTASVSQLTVTKTADTTDFSSPVTSGDTITYTITAENTGNVALDNVRITDTQTPTGGSSSSLTPTYISGDTDSDSAIDVGETWTWTVSYDLTQADIDAGGLSNLATVTVDDPDGTEITVESSTSGNHTTGAGNGTGTSTTLTPSPGLTVTKTADKTTISPSSAGDTISYTITVKNTGNVTFNSLSLTDALTSDEAWSESDGGDADGTGALDVGETWTFTASYAITPSDITEGSVENVAYATGIPTSGGSLTVYSGAQDEASTATSDPSGGGGVITTLTASSLISEIEDDLIQILRDDLTVTMRQQSKQMAGYSIAALDRLKSENQKTCVDLVNEQLAREPVLFLTASATLTQASRTTLDNLAKLLAQCPDETFDVEGHTDNVGSHEYNLRLSYARSAAVVSALVSRGLKPERFVAFGHGETRPIAENVTEEGRRLNRRVVFVPAIPNSMNINCQAPANYERRFYAKVDDSGANVDGIVSRDIDSCGNGEREFYEIRGSYLVQGAYTRHGMVTFNYLKEHTSASDRIWGQFLGVYASTNTVADGGTGKIDGYGLNAGLYGAQRIDTNLYLDYYLGAASGQHNFELNFSRASGDISTNGYYKYFATFAGVALSGETKIGDQSLEPRAGFQVAYSPGGQAQVNASREALQDSRTLEIGAVNGGRAFGEIRFADLLPNNTAQISVAPRGFCDTQIGTGVKQCGAGISLDFSRHIEEGHFFNFSLDGEVINTNRSYSITLEYGLNLEQGQLTGSTSVGANGAGEIGTVYKVSF